MIQSITEIGSPEGLRFAREDQLFKMKLWLNPGAQPYNVRIEYDIEQDGDWEYNSWKTCIGTDSEEDAKQKAYSQFEWEYGVEDGECPPISDCDFTISIDEELQKEWDMIRKLW